jgi:uncharacterized membrane protein
MASDSSDTEKASSPRPAHNRVLIWIVIFGLILAFTFGIKKPGANTSSPNEDRLMIAAQIWAPWLIFLALFYFAVVRKTTSVDNADEPAKGRIGLWTVLLCGTVMTVFFIFRAHSERAAVDTSDNKNPILQAMVNWMPWILLFLVFYFVVLRILNAATSDDIKKNNDSVALMLSGRLDEAAVLLDGLLKLNKPNLRNLLLPIGPHYMCTSKTMMKQNLLWQSSQPIKI